MIVRAVADRQAVEVAAGVLGELALRDEPLAPLTTYRVGGSAALFVAASEVSHLVTVARARAASGLPVLVVGRGSNLLVADAGFGGIAVTTAGFADRIELDAELDLETSTETNTQTNTETNGASGGDRFVTAGSGVSLPVLARRTAAAGLTGFEWAVGVPGSVGGAVRMNAGGHGSDMAASLVDVELVDLDDGCGEQACGDRAWGADTPGPVRTVAAADLDLGYRSSSLSDAQVVVSARLRLARGDRERSEREIADIVRWRREHQPGGQNCGSVFANPVPGEVTAGGLIDGLGLRGLTVGGAQVSNKHANFIQAEPGALAADVHDLIELVRQRVAAATGHVMRSEVRMVGFEPDGGRRP